MRSLVAASTIVAIALVFAPSTVPAGDDGDGMIVRVVLTTEAGNVGSCTFLVTVRDDSVKDLRKKIMSVGGDTGLMSFTSSDVILARAYRCASNQGVAAPPPPPPGPPPAPPAASLDGLFKGTMSGGSGENATPTNVTFSVVQSGAHVGAVWTTTGGASGELSAALAGSALSAVKVRQVAPCAGEFVGVAVIEGGGNRLRGSYVGSDCQGQASGSFTVDRQ